MLRVCLLRAGLPEEGLDQSAFKGISACENAHNAFRSGGRALTSGLVGAAERLTGHDPEYGSACAHLGAAPWQEAGPAETGSDPLNPEYQHGLKGVR